MRVFYRLVTIFLLASATTAAFAERRALVIGNANYTVDGKDAPNVKLPRSIADARSVAATLVEVGFAKNRVSLATDVNNLSMAEAIEQFAQTIEPGDEVVFYFSGHGISTDSGGNFLVPIDAPLLDLQASDLSLVSRFQSLKLVLDALQSRNPRMVIAILDACRSYPTRQVNSRTKTLERQVTGMNTQGQVAEGQLIMYAASHGRGALPRLYRSPDNDAHSVYTRVLLEEMRRPAENVVAMAHRVATRVRELTKNEEPGYTQQPEFQSKLAGDFTFTPPLVNAPVTAETSKDQEIARLQAALAQATKPAATQQQVIEGYEILDDPVLGKGSLALDLKTGLVWQRCSVGQRWDRRTWWDERTCIGEAKEFGDFVEVQKLAGKGWRLPTTRELATLNRCSYGKTNDPDGPRDGGEPIDNYRKGDYKHPTIRTAAFPQFEDGFYFSTQGEALYVKISNCGIGRPFKLYNSRVILVRSSQ
jgi:uncharacterized caspase-like protein